MLPVYVFDETGNVNPAALKNYLDHHRISNEEFNDLIKEALSRELALDLVEVAGYVPQFAVQEQFMHDFAKKRYSIMTIPFEPVLKNEQATAVTDEEVKKFYDAQNRSSKRYWTKEKRDGTTWTFGSKKFGITVTDKDLESYYQDNRGLKFVSVPTKLEVRTIVFHGTDQAILDKARKIHQELIANPEPDNFAHKVKELSEDKETAKNGGLMPLFAKGTHDKAFEKAAFLLKNDGDISDPVVTARGVEIIQRVAKKQPEYKPLDAVKNEIKELLEVEKFKEEFNEAVGSLIDQNDEAAFKKFIEDHEGVQGTLSAEQGQANHAAKALFGLHEKGSITSYYENNTEIIVKLTEIHKREIPALELVRATVVQDMHKERAEKGFQ